MSPSLLHRARLDLCLSGCQFPLAAVTSGHRQGLKTAQVCHPVSEIPYPLGTGTCIPSGGTPIQLRVATYVLWPLVPWLCLQSQ